MDARVQAWAFLDPSHALGQAREADAWRRAGRPLGVQLVGPPHGDARLLRTARWLESCLAAG